MKDLMLYTVVLLVSVVFLSCEKDECECTVGGKVEVIGESDVANGSLKTYCSERDQFLTPPDECHIR